MGSLRREGMSYHSVVRRVPSEICWIEESEEHIGRHGIEPAEVEEAAYTRLRLTAPGREGTWLVFGTTTAGRHLLVILAEAQDGSDTA